MLIETLSNKLTAKRIFVVEDHPLTRQGLIATIASRPEWQVCGEANSAEEALSRMEADQPDLAVVDLLLDEGNGLDLIKEMQTRYPRVKILVLSSCEEMLFAERAMRAGAMGYIHKRFALAKIVEAIEKILKGECFLSPELEQRLLSLGVSKRKQVTDDPVQQLSNRELEVFELIGQGLKSKQIADRLQISVHTVDSHREKIRHKLGLKSGNELMQRAVVWTLKGCSAGLTLPASMSEVCCLKNAGGPSCYLARGIPKLALLFGFASSRQKRPFARAGFRLASDRPRCFELAVVKFQGLETHQSWRVGCPL